MSSTVDTKNRTSSKKEHFTPLSPTHIVPAYMRSTTCSSSSLSSSSLRVPRYCSKDNVIRFSSSTLSASQPRWYAQLIAGLRTFREAVRRLILMKCFLLYPVPRSRRQGLVVIRVRTWYTLQFFKEQVARRLQPELAGMNNQSLHLWRSIWGGHFFFLPSVLMVLAEEITAMHSCWI